MCRFFRWTAVIALAACLTPALADEQNSPDGPMTLRYNPQFILEAVARRMGVTLRPEVPVPAVLLASRTPLRAFQHAIEPQWQFRPHVITNAYVSAQNEIYLADGASYYMRFNRTLDDSLAHEFVHFVQANYFNADRDSDSNEPEAVAVQTWFREAYMRPPQAERPLVHVAERQAP